ncbi:hypothetical protein H3C67_04120 [Candidatus Dojkabacteria bacterium]|uniref:Glucose-6-phosphate isomerase n=2 Tax=Candidatus Dojkabacteria TaxID=74243 RepID=A0A136KI31_9BACT|nr:MAG: Glucose-6-phosphate isomerase [candidate division WS6 bacterium OLB21]MBW7953949.1 hypothetical protein [Candidatus Dojkabacteria bacterium]
MDTNKMQQSIKITPAPKNRVEEYFASNRYLQKYEMHLGKVYSERKYNDPASSLCLPHDEELLSAVGAAVDAVVSPDLRWVVVVGIGGSNLGTQAVYEALNGVEANLKDSVTPKLFFLDTNSPLRVKALFELLDRDIVSIEQVVVNVISKSGTTTETAANFEVIFQYLQNRFGKDAKKQFVITTDIDSKLWIAAKAKGLLLLPVPKEVGGRFSVFSAVGLFPLMLAGVYIEDFRAGAVEMLKSLGSYNLKQNLAMQSALEIYTNYLEDRETYVNFFFNPELESLGKWYRQLMAESLGKKDNIHYAEVRTGITPVVSIGSVDLHSMAQLYFGGPNDKFTSIIYAQDNSLDVKVPEKLELDLVDSLKGKSFSNITEAIIAGLDLAYANNNIPCNRIEIAEISAKTLGAYMQMRMLEIMYMGHFMNIDAFNQPSVEDYKNETRKFLEK